MIHPLRDFIKEERRRKLKQCAPVHKSILSKAAVADCGFEEIDYLPYSQDLAPSDYLLFPNLKKPLRGTTFRKIVELIAAAEGHFRDKLNEYVYSGLKMLLKRQYLFSKARELH